MTLIAAVLTGGVGLEITKSVTKRWQEARGRRESANFKIQTLIEHVYKIRRIAAEHGATEEELGPVPSV